MTSITVKLQEEEKMELARLAEQMDLNMSQIVRRAIKEYIKKNEENK